VEARFVNDELDGMRKKVVSYLKVIIIIIIIVVVVFQGMGLLACSGSEFIF
jgi:t-SNARE complex subunit (syntaxin)